MWVSAQKNRRIQDYFSHFHIYVNFTVSMSEYSLIWILDLVTLKTLIAKSLIDAGLQSLIPD